MWETVKLEDIADVKAGNPAPQDKNLFEHGVYPFVRTSDVGKVKVGSLSDANDKLNQQGIAKLKLFPKGTILFPKSGASTFLNHRVILEMDAYVASHLATIKSKQDDVSDKYLWYFLQNIDAADLVADSAYPSLNTKTIQSIPISLPPLEEQERIVAKLDAAFAEIDEAKKIASSAADSANQLFKKKLSLIFLTSRSGWHNTTIVNCCQLKSGNTINKALEKTEGELPYLKVADMNLASNVNGVITSSRFVSKADISDKALIKKGSVIFPKRGGAIATNKKRLTLTDICADLNIMSVYPQASLIPELLYYFFKNIDMAMLGSGSSIPQINNYDIEPLSISYPVDKREQLNLASKLKDIEHETKRLAATYQCKVAELIKLKSAILLKELQPSEAA